VVLVVVVVAQPTPPAALTVHTAAASLEKAALTSAVPASK
jgi:hypothetical protein